MRKPKAARSQAYSRLDQKLIFEPYYQSTQENDERIRRLAKKILVCVQAAHKRKSKGQKEIENVNQILGEREIV